MKVRRLFLFFLFNKQFRLGSLELQIGWGEIVTAFHVETKPLALNAFSKSRFVFGSATKKVKITEYPESSRLHPYIVPSVTILRWLLPRSLLETKNDYDTHTILQTPSGSFFGRRAFVRLNRIRPGPRRG